jgi:hypothetical protein
MGWLARQRAKFANKDKDGLHEGGTTGSSVGDFLGRLVWYDPYQTNEENLSGSWDAAQYLKDGFQWTDIQSIYRDRMQPKDKTMKPSKSKAVRSGPRFTLKKKNPMGYAGKKTDPGYKSPDSLMGPGRAADDILNDRFGSSSVFGPSASSGMDYDDDQELVAGVPNLVTYGAGAALAWLAWKRFF